MNSDLFLQATIAHRNNQLSKAKELYQKILLKEENNFETLFLLGTLYLQEKKYSNSIKHLTKANELKNNDIHNIMNLGVAYKEDGQLIIAEKYLKKAFKLNKYNSDVCNNLGNLYLTSQKFDDSLHFFKLAIQINPQNFSYMLNIADCYYQMSLIKESIEVLSNIPSTSDFFIQSQQKLFNIFYKTKNYKQCVLIGENLIKISNNPDEFISKTFLSMLALGETNQAKKLLNLFKNNDEKKFHTALLLMEELKYKESKDILTLLSSQKNYELLCHHNLGVLNFRSNNFVMAIDHFKKALHKNSDFVESQIQLGLCQLAQCNFKEGWDNFYHYQNQKFFNWNYLKELKRWDGYKLNSKILIIFDQGLGDQIFFSSLINSLPNLNQYYCVVNKKLLDIFKQSFSENIYFLEETAIGNLKGYDFYIRATELGKLYIRDKNDLKKQRMYLKAKKSDVIDKKAIGLSWHSSNQLIGRKKSINLESLIVSLKSKSKYFVNLQYGEFGDEIKRLSLKHNVNFINHDSIDNYNDITGLAGLILACDEIYSISNTTAHLAGALGVKVSLVLPFNHQSNTWYWFSDQDNRSLWYPNVKVIEATANQDLSSALKKIK